MENTVTGGGSDGDISSLPRVPLLTSLASDLIAEAIVRGQFSPGTPLPEVPLAKRLNTSRATVREALREVETLGLVEIEAHRGAFVRPISSDRLQEVFSLRAILESFAARLSMERADRAAIAAAVESAYQRLIDAVEGGEMMELVRMDVEFHNALSSFCGHELLLQHLDSLKLETLRFIVSVQQYSTDRRLTAGTHLPILDAIRSGEPGDVERVVYEHVMESGEKLLARLAA